MTDRLPGSRTAGRRPPGSRVLALYPTGWRRRYESEMLATLEELRLGWRGRLDLLRGALDAWLHSPSRIPAVAALVAGGSWTYAASRIVAQPAPPDWPGYTHESLPLAIVATALGGIAIVFCWARRSDDGGRLGSLAVILATVGHALWLLAVGATWLGLGYGAVTMAAQSVGVIGAILVGLVLLRAGDGRIGAVLVVAPSLMLFGSALGWLGFGLGLTVVGVLMLQPEPDGARPARFA
jgi:hypothetical protein